MTRIVRNTFAPVRAMFRLTTTPIVNVLLVLCWWPFALVIALLVWPFPIAAKLFLSIGFFPFLILRRGGRDYY